VKSAERQLRIREILDAQEFVDLDTLSAELETSGSSIRRDLSALEASGVLKRVHGGALAIHPRSHLLDNSWQKTRNSDQKRRIGAATASLIENDMTVILDGGSTVEAVASCLADRSLNVVTNSIAIAKVLGDARRIEVTLTGGYLYPRLEILLGPLCENMLSGIAADLLVMGIGGITEAGLSNNNTPLVGSQRRMIEVARRVIIVADHTKFGRAAMVPLAPLDVVDTIVSDTELAPSWRRLLKRNAVELLLA